MKKIKYFAIIAASIFTLTSCTDIVEVDDLKAKENKPSTGAPTVDKVVLATDAEFPIDGANFEQVVRIEGTNLGDITSLKFNDIEVDNKEIYSTYDMLLAPIPRALPKEVSKFKWKKADISGKSAGRTRDLLMHKDRRGKKRRVRTF